MTPTRTWDRAARWVRALAFLALMGAVVVPGTPAGARSDTTIQLRPAVGPPTTKAKVIGKEFGPTEVVDITFDRSQVGTATTDPQGAFSAKVTVPSSALPGKHRVRATGESSGLRASRKFVVRTDWAKFHFDSNNSGFNPYENVLDPSNVGSLAQRWTAKTGGAVYSSPAVANGVVYVGSYNGKVYALNASTGASVWTAATGGAVWSSPAVANDVVYVGSLDGKVYAWNASTGAKLWTALTYGAIYSSPAVANGVVYVGSDDTRVYALNASTGHRLWTFTTEGFVGSPPDVAGGVLYVGSTGPQMGQNYALNASTGEVLWIGDGGYFGSSSSPAVAEALVYVGIDQSLSALNASNGRPVWTVATGDFVDSSPAVANGLVYVGSEDDKVYAMNASTGATLWRATTGGPVWSSPAVANGMVYVGSEDDKVYAFGLP
jgi:outer membrane protein assembly factor BamB